MRKLIAILFPVALAFTGNAQQQDSLEITIRQLEQQVVAGILAADTNLLKSLWAPEFIVNTPRNTIAPNREAVLEIQKAGLINYSLFERTIEAIQVLDNMAITMGSEVFVSRNDIPGAKAGQPVKRRFTNVWIKQNGRWVQRARHASVICS
ncbi:MAG: nuclear transport factor 2 family protein [Chitinophagaceae bacterium]|nr:MAG: nuclear transport factor 2 family protein [Chitinophagaceae bacterium]